MFDGVIQRNPYMSCFTVKNTFLLDANKPIQSMAVSNYLQFQVQVIEEEATRWICCSPCFFPQRWMPLTEKLCPSKTGLSFSPHSVGSQYPVFNLLRTQGQASFIYFYLLVLLCFRPHFVIQWKNKENKAISAF